MCKCAGEIPKAKKTLACNKQIPPLPDSYRGEGVKGVGIILAAVCRLLTTVYFYPKIFLIASILKLLQISLASGV
jgi:hypothetical protein